MQCARARLAHCQITSPTSSLATLKGFGGRNYTCTLFLDTVNKEARASGKCNDGRQDGQRRDGAEEKATMSREGLFVQKSYKKDPPIALDFDHKLYIYFLVKPDCCAGKCRQESELFFFFVVVSVVALEM